MWRLGPYRLDPIGFSLELGEDRVPLQRRPFDLLLYLVAHRDRVVSRDELLSEVWGGLAVVDGAISTAVYEARAALGDDERRGPERWIQTVRGRGFRYRGPVSSQDGPSTETALGPFVGRRRILASLRGRVEDARGGRGSAVLIEGRAGVGKTRLVEELLSPLPRAKVRIAHCEPGAPPLWPWQQLARGRAQAEGSASEGPWPDEDEAEDSLGLEFQRVDAFARRLRAAARAGLRVVVVEDLHWADPPTLSMFEALASRLGDVGIVLVGTRRSETENAPPVLLRRSSHLARLGLDPLAPTQLYPLVEAITGRIPSPELVGWIARYSQGLPLMVQALAERVLEVGEAVIDVPQIAQRVFRERFERLDEASRRGMGIASLCGERFDAPLVEAAAGDALAPDRTWIREGLRHGVLVSVREHPLRFAFRHALLREAAEGLLDPIDVPGWHRRIVTVLEGQRAEPTDALIAQLARHAAAAAVETPGVDVPLRYSILAARRAARVLSWGEVAEHASHVLGWIDFLPQSAERDAQEVEAGLLRCAAIAYSSGHVEETETLLERIAPAIARAEDPGLHAREESFRFAIARCRGDYARARIALDRIGAVEGLEEFALCLRIGIEILTGDFAAEGADLAWGDEMPTTPSFHAFARSCGRDPAIDRLGFSAFALWARGEDALAVSRAERAEAWTRDSGDERGRIWALFLLCMLHEMRRDWAALGRWAPEIEQASQRSGVNSWLGLGTGLRLWAEAREKGGPGAEIRPLAAVLEDRGRSSSTTFSSPLLLLASRVYTWAGDLEAAGRAVRAGIEWADRTGEGMVIAELHRQLGQVLLRSGRREEAEATWRRALELAGRQGHRMAEARAAADLEGCISEIGPARDR